MLIIIISRSSLKLGHIGSKTRLLGQQATQVSDLGPLWPSCFIIMSPDPYFTSFSFREHNSATVKNNLMIHGRMIEQVNTECHIQE